MRRGYDMALMEQVVSALASGETLPPKNRDHAGDYIGCRECHITPDWLLAYEIADDVLALYLTRTRTHSGLF